MNLKAGNVFRIASYVVLILVAVLYGAHLVWKSSGNSEWEIVREENGLIVYTMKVPGETLLKYKFNMTVDARLTDIVYYMTDINTGAELGAKDLHRIEHLESDPVVINYDTYKIDLAPFGMREVVIVLQYEQDPVTGIVDMNIAAAPGKIPLTDGLKRIQHLSNHWKMTPIEPGKVKLETTSDVDMGIPYFLSNMVLADVVYDTTAQMRELLKKEKFRNQVALYVKEPFVNNPLVSE